MHPRPILTHEPLGARQTPSMISPRVLDGDGQAPVITAAGASAQTRAMVREANANTWFVVERLGEVRAPGRGSRPGAGAPPEQAVGLALLAVVW